MKKLTLLLPLAATLLLSSCAFHSGYIQNSAALTKANFKYIKTDVSGNSQATYVFGIGGLGKQSLIDLAKERMKNKISLKDNQALVNISTNVKNSNFFFVQFKKITLTADVVEFTD